MLLQFQEVLRSVRAVTSCWADRSLAASRVAAFRARVPIPQLSMFAKWREATLLVLCCLQHDTMLNIVASEAAFFCLDRARWGPRGMLDGARLRLIDRGALRPFRPFVHVVSDRLLLAVRLVQQEAPLLLTSPLVVRRDGLVQLLLHDLVQLIPLGRRTLSVATR